MRKVYARKLISPLLIAVLSSFLAAGTARAQEATDRDGPLARPRSAATPPGPSRQIEDPGRGTAPQRTVLPPGTSEGRPATQHANTENVRAGEAQPSTTDRPATRDTAGGGIPQPGSRVPAPTRTTADDPLGWGLESHDPVIRKKAQAVLLAQYEREINRLQEHSRTFGWNHTASVIIFWIAHVLLAVAVWAALREFVEAGQVRREARRIKGAASGPEQVPVMQEIEIGMERVALRTTLHGLLILAAAMCFYFLYLKFVYTIVPVATHGAAAL